MLLTDHLYNLLPSSLSYHCSNVSRALRKVDEPIPEEQQRATKAAQPGGAFMAKICWLVGADAVYRFATTGMLELSMLISLILITLLHKTFRHWRLLEQTRAQQVPC